MHEDPTATIAEDGDDEVDVDTAATTYIGPPPPSLRAMMDLADYRRAVPPSPPSDS